MAEDEKPAARPNLPPRIPTTLPADFCFIYEDNPNAITGNHLRPKVLHLFLSIEGAIQLSKAMTVAAIYTPKEEDQIVSFSLPAHMFRAGEVPRRKREPGESGIVGPDGAPVEETHG